MRKIRIFISSPGDVRQERSIAQHVLAELGRLYAPYAELEVLMWEDFPLTSDTTFQEGINYFLENEVIDIAVFILWSRLGTPLCTKFTKPDGSPYNSGTEYEFDLMNRFRLAEGWPRFILTYVKESECRPAVGNMEELLEEFRQKERVQAFLREHFRDEASNSNYAYMQFGEGATFEQKFRTHMRGAIKSILGDVGEIREWEGNPYVGLNSFEYDQSSIFCGRKQLVYETISRLIDLTDESDRKSLIVLGESGAGKSSFVKAGLLPFICDKESDRGDYVIVSPSMYAGDMYRGLLDLLVERFAFLRDNPFVDELRSGIDEQKNFRHLAYAFEQHRPKELILYIDQFEELFSDNTITEQERRSVILLLQGIVASRTIRIFLSLRSDFYNCFSSYGGLAQIKRQCVTVDIPSVDYAEITEIVEEPARKACLRWEIGDDGTGLNQRIIREASVIRDLPLIEFALAKLYDVRDANDQLTFEAYERIGGLRGAIVTYAQEVYAGLSEAEKKAFEDLLGFVVTESSFHRTTYVRKTSRRKDVEKTRLHKTLVDKLVAAHLFVSGKNSRGEATVSLTHDMLIRSWNVIAGWVEREKDFLSRNAHYEQLAQFWLDSRRSDKYLVVGRTPLLEAEYHLYKNEERISRDVSAFLRASIRKEKRKGLIWRCLVFCAVLFSFGCFFVAKFAGVEYDSDFDEWTGINSLSYTDAFLLFGGILSMLGHGIVQKIRGVPEYRTVKSSTIVWSVIAAIFIAFDLSVTGFLFYTVPVLIVAASYAWEWRRRKRWNRKFVPYLLSDDGMHRLKTVSVSALAIFIVLCTSVLYMGAMSDKEERLSRRAEVTDKLFYGLDQIKDRLGSGDVLYINGLWKDYLEENFAEELQDTICDQRELEYARCLYNLQQPVKAMIYLYPNHQWDHHLFYAMCLARAGRYDGHLDEVLESYVEGDRYDEVGSHSSADLIWIAEKAGRFDLAERMYGILADTLPQMLEIPALRINRGHIDLHEGRLDEAARRYRQALSEAERYNFTNGMIAFELRRDFHTLSRFRAVDDDRLEEMSELIGVEFVPAYLPEVDSVVLADTYARLAGDWRWDAGEGIIVRMHVDPDNRLLTSDVYDRDGDLASRTLSECRFAWVGEELYWDEFDLSTDDNSLGRIVELTDDRLVLEVIENGDPQQKGQRREYVRDPEQA